MKAINFLLALAVFCTGCFSLTVGRKWMPIGDGKRGIIYDSISMGGLMDSSHSNVRAYDATFSKPVPPEMTPEEAMADLQKLEPLQTTVATQEGVINKVIGAVVGPATMGGVYGYFAVQAAKALRPDVTNINATAQQLTDVDVSTKLITTPAPKPPSHHHDSGY